MAQERENRFAGASGGSDVEAGYRDVVNTDPLNNAYIKRNLKPYKSLKKFSTNKGFKKLKTIGDQRLEKMATRAVMQKAGVKRRKLPTKINTNKFNKTQLTRARQLLNQGKKPGQAANPKVRKATRHVQTIRRNRRIMNTNIFAGKGYDIMKGYI